MKFKKIWADSFGCLNGWESPELDQGLVVILGSNESGKTTIFKLISTIIYGFNPVSNNPYIPWDKETAKCEALLIDDSGQEFKVFRKLKSRPEGTMVINDKKYELLNRPIFQANHIPADIFEEVFALTLDELCLPDASIWQGIQDQILGGQFKSLFNPISTVLSQLEDEAGKLWRPNRLGKPKDKELGELYKGLKERLKQSEENEMRIRQLEEDIFKLNENIKALQDKKVEIQKYINRYERLYPVVKKLKKIEELNKKAGNVSDFAGALDFEKVLKEISEKIESLNIEYEKASKQREEILSRINIFNEQDKKVLEFKDDIEALIKSYAQAESDIILASQLDQDIIRLKDRICLKAKDILQGGWYDSLSSAVKSIDEAKLKANIQSFKSKDARYQEQKALTEGLKARYGLFNFSKFLPWIFMIFCVLSLSGLFIEKEASFKIFFGTIFIMFLILLVISLSAKMGRSGANILKEAEKNLKKIESEKNMQFESIKALLKGLPLADERLNFIDDSLFLDVATLKGLCENIDDYIQKRQIIKVRIDEAKIKANELSYRCGIKTGDDLKGTFAMLEKALKEADERFFIFKDAKAKLEECEINLKNISEKKEAAEKQFSEMMRRINMFEGETIEEKISNFKERASNLNKALNMKEELETEHPDLEDILKEIKLLESENEKWLFEDEGALRHKMELEEINNALNELNEKLGSLKKEIEDRRQHETMDDIKGQMSEIEEERIRIAKKRDRLILLKNIIIEADRIFREENQPDLILRAGRYLKNITGGRYTNIYMDQYDGMLAVKGSSFNEPLNIKNTNLSRGTKEQIYLSLRLALQKHLTDGQESMPAFFDEVLVNWDGVRAQNMIELLKDLAVDQQVMLFTCHKSLAEMISKNNCAQVIEL